MKVLALYVLMTMSGPHQVWSFSGPMSEGQCETLKRAVMAEVRPIGWSQNGVEAPTLLKCARVE